MRYRELLLVASLLSVGGAARGDVPTPGYKRVQWEGVLEVPTPPEGVKYVLYPAGLGSGWRELVPGEPFGPTRMSACVYAIKDALPDPNDRDAEERFFHRADLPRSAPLEAPDRIPDSDPRARIRVLYRVEGIEGSVVKLTWTEQAWDGAGQVVFEQRGASDAQVQKQPPTVQTSGGWCALTRPPGHSQTAALPGDMPLVGLSLTALLLLAALARRRARGPV